MTPPALDRVVRTCLAKHPEDRWQSAADVARELRWITDEPISVATSHSRKSNLAAIIVAAIALLAILAAVAMCKREVVSRLTSDPEWEWGPIWSADGRWVAYCSGESGRGEIYIQAFSATGEKIQVTTTGGLRPAWRPDGRELYFLDPAGALHAVAITPGETVTPGKPVLLFATDFRLANDRTYYTALPDGRFLLLKEISKRINGPVRLVRNWASTLED